MVGILGRGHTPPVSTQKGMDMGKIRHALTRAHLWIGEVLGLTHYRNCHGCEHCKSYKELGPNIIGCDLHLKEHGILAITDPCEAVWCYEYAEKLGKEQ